MPHRPRAAPCSRPCRTSGADPRGSRASCGCGSGPPSPGSCSGSRVVAGRRGSPGAVRLVRTTLSGRVRGRPGPSRGTRIRSRTGWNCGESPRCPAVITSRHGLLALLDGQVELGGQPARERPSPWSSGSVKTPPGEAPSADPPFARAGRMLVGPGDRGVHRDVPGDRPSASAPACSCSKMRCRCRPVASVGTVYKRSQGPYRRARPATAPPPSPPPPPPS